MLIFFEKKKKKFVQVFFCQQFTLNWLVFFYSILPLAFFFAERMSIL